MAGMKPCETMEATCKAVDTPAGDYGDASLLVLADCTETPRLRLLWWRHFTAAPSPMDNIPSKRANDFFHQIRLSQAGVRMGHKEQTLKALDRGIKTSRFRAGDRWRTTVR